MSETLENILIFIGGAMTGSTILAFWLLFFSALRQKEENCHLSKYETETKKAPDHIDTKV